MEGGIHRVGLSFDYPHVQNSEEALLFTACETGHAQAVENLLKTVSPAIKDTKGRFPIQVAAENGHVEIMKKLFEKDTERECWSLENGETLLHLAAKLGNMDLVEQIAKKFEE